MSGAKASSTFKRCRSAIDVTDPILRKIAREINFAEMLLVQYLKEVSENRSSGSPSESNAIEHLSQLILKELQCLRKVKASQVVDVTGSFVTFRSDDGEFLVTVVPEEELQRTFHPLFSFRNVRPRFAKPVVSRDDFAGPSPSAESVYHDAFYELPGDVPDLPSGTSAIGRSIYGLLNYIFASTIGRLENGDT